MMKHWFLSLFCCLFLVNIDVINGFKYLDVRLKRVGTCTRPSAQCCPSQTLSSSNMKLFSHTAEIDETLSHPHPEKTSSTNGLGPLSVISYKELIAFGLPTLGIWLLQPILSLIDTAVVGMSRSTSLAELAALGPGIAWVDSTSYLFNFLGVATTNLFANALLSKDNPERKSRGVLTNAGALSIGFGLALGVVQYLAAPQMITHLSGTSIQSIKYGIQYARIRSIAAPAALLTISAQAAFLAGKDSVTPLKAVLVGAAVNILGDIALVSFGKYGIVGAAWATALSQFAGISYLLYAAIQLRQKQSVEPETTTIQDENKKFLVIKPRKSWLEIIRADIIKPSLSESLQFLQFCGPLFVILLIKSFLWTYTTFAASTGGTADLAAHQITINFFLLFCIFGDVVAQMSQTFLPYYLQHGNNNNQDSCKCVGDIKAKHDPIQNDTTITSDANVKPATATTTSDMLLSWNPEAKLIVNRINNMSVVLGVLNSIIGVVLCTFGAQFFTKSSEVALKMRQVAPLLALCAFPHCLMLAFEGVIVVSRDLSFLSFVYMILGPVFIAYQTIVRKQAAGSAGVWLGMIGLQWARLFLFGRRVHSLTKLSSKKIVNRSENSNK